MPRRNPGGGCVRRPELRLRQRGMVTVELAIGIVTAVFVTALLAGLAQVGLVQAASAESAAQLARQAARADEAAYQEAMDRRPVGADVNLQRQPDGVEAVVTAEVRLLGIGALEVSATAWAAYEPGVSP